MIHPLMLAAVAAGSEWEYYSEEPRKDHTDTENMPGMDAEDTAAAQAPAEDETSLLETGIVETPGLGDMREPQTIDSKLRHLVAARRSLRKHRIEASDRQGDELLDEHLSHRGRAGEDAAVDS